MAPIVAKVDALAQAVVVRTFHDLLDWVATLPVNTVTTWLDGALLMIRKSLFNQTASVSAVQTVNSTLVVRGKIDVIDPEGDGYTIEVADGPAHGTVALETTSQANGIGTTKYIYTPNQGYAGDDQFVVKITPTSSTFNILHPFGVLNTRYYTVAVGDPAVSATALAADPKDSLDTTLFMANAAATVTVQKRGLLFPQFTATVTLPATAINRGFDWMDTRGRQGTVAVDEMLTEHWSAFGAKADRNGVKPLLMFSYTDQGGGKTVFVDVDQVTKNADGTYQFTGQLTDDVPAQTGRVDRWDFVGIDYRADYQNFLATAGLNDCKTGQVCTTVSAVGILGATTLAPDAAREAGYHDYPVPTPDQASATQTSPGSMGPGTTDSNQGNGTAVFGNSGDGDTNLTAMIPWGSNGSFITATNLADNDQANNGIYLYTANAPAGGQAGGTSTWAPTELTGDGWNAAVNVLAQYNQTTTTTLAGSVSPTTYTLNGTIGEDQYVAAFTGSISGTTLTVTDIPTGQIYTNFVVVGGPADNTQITGFGSGSGGVGTYTVTPSQTWPAGGGTGQMVADNGAGTLLAVTLPADVDPTSLVGASVTGANVASGTTITSYDSLSGTTSYYTVSTSNLAAGAFTVTLSGPPNLLTLALPNTIDPGSLIGQAITGTGIAGGTVINGFVADNNTSGSSSSYTYTVSNSIAPGTVSVTLPNLPTLLPGVVVGLSDGAVEYWNGGGCSATSAGCDASVASQAFGGGWTQLQESNGAAWGDDVAVNTLISLPNNQGIAVGLSNGAVFLWNNAIMPDGTIVPGSGVSGDCSNSNVGSCWTQLQDTGWDSAVNVMTPYGQNGGLVVGLADGSVQQWNGSAWNPLQGTGWSSAVNTITPYDGTTFFGAIGGEVVVTDQGAIEAPSYLDSLAGSAALSASTNACQSSSASSSATTSYNSGSATGCGGYVLTVQQAAGNPLQVGQTLFGGAGLVAGTTITAQISDSSGNLCASSCNEGGEGVYLVSNSQLVAPGTPMSASDGTGFIVGLADGSVQQWTGSGWTQLQGNVWGSAVNTAIPWRDGIAVGLDNGAVFYWSPSNNPGNNNPSNPNALSYYGTTITSQTSQGAGWSQLQGTGWSNAVTSMVQMGDGFVVGLTAPGNSNNGAIELFQGYGPASSTTAFGFDASGQVSPSNSWTEIASQSALSGNSPQGSVQQFVPVSGYMTDPSTGATVLGETLLAGLTNNGIYAWNGSNQNTGTTTWAQVQPPDISKPSLSSSGLSSAWAFAGTTSSSIAFGSPGGIGDPTSTTGDPIFGAVAGNQAWCGDDCSSNGDYVPLVLNEQFGDGGVIYSLGNNELQGDITLSSLGYGYIFVPNGTWDKFRPSKYSVGMVVGVQGGAAVNLSLPNGTLALNWSDTVTGPHYTKTEYTEIGEFSLDVGLNANVGANVSLSNNPNAPMTLAYANFTPGLLYTWNVNSYLDQMSLSFNYFADSGYLSPSAAAQYLESGAQASFSAGVTPYLNGNYGLYTPANTPIIGQWSVFDLGLGYQNPVSFNVSIPDLTQPTDLQMSVTSQGFVNVNAGFLPNLTSLLSWSDQFQVYSVTAALQTGSGTLNGPTTA